MERWLPQSPPNQGHDFPLDDFKVIIGYFMVMDVHNGYSGVFMRDDRKQHPTLTQNFTLEDSTRMEKASIEHRNHTTCRNVRTEGRMHDMGVERRREQSHRPRSTMSLLETSGSRGLDEPSSKVQTSPSKAFLRGKKCSSVPGGHNKTLVPKNPAKATALAKLGQKPPVGIYRINHYPGGNDQKHGPHQSEDGNHWAPGNPP